MIRAGVFSGTGGDQTNQDRDGDDFGTTADTIVACDAPAGYSAYSTDCDDDPNGNGSSVNPDKDELCWTNFDDNCDGVINEDTAADATTWYADADDDTYGDPNDTKTACSQPTGYVDRAGDCNDGDDAINEGALEVCETNSIRPDGIDNDCDGEVDEPSADDADTYFRDEDGDGFGDPNTTTPACSVPAGYTVDDTDCNDDPNNDGNLANPGKLEVCDGMDNDCDGTIDDGCPKYYTIRTGSVATKDKIGTDYNDEGEKTSVCGANRVWTDANLHYYKDDYPIQEIDIGCRDIVVNEDRSSTPYSYSVGHDNYESVDGAGGWDGSSDYAEFSCGDGEAIYKVSIEYNELLYKVEFHCRKYGLIGSGTSVTMNPGSVTTERSYGGDAYYKETAKCGANQVAIGARMNADKTNGNYFAIYGFELHCQTLELDKK